MDLGFRLIMMMFNQVEFTKRQWVTISTLHMSQLNTQTQPAKHDADTISKPSTLRTATQISSISHRLDLW
jgi:hypothetical protein